MEVTPKQEEKKLEQKKMFNLWALCANGIITEKKFAPIVF